MSEQGATQQIDSILLPFLRSADKEESKHLLEEIVFKYADNIIKAIISVEMRVSLDRAGLKDWNSDQFQDAKDVYNDAVEKLLKRLQELKSDSGAGTITDLRSYVGSVTKNACYNYLRQKYPKRCMLKNRLRYLLIHREDFALWESKMEELLCGLAKWNGIDRAALRGDIAERVRVSAAAVASMDLAELLAAIFKQVGRPLLLDDLVELIADLGGVKEQAYSKVNYEDWSAAHITKKMEQQSYLKRLWAEICKLPFRQRIALLLNLRGENGNGIELFVFIGLTNIRNMAELLGIPVEQFAVLWNELPLEDAAIAERLGVARQQVINLRSAARDRLARKMKGL